MNLFREASFRSFSEKLKIPRTSRASLFIEFRDLKEFESDFSEFGASRLLKGENKVRDLVGCFEAFKKTKKEPFSTGLLDQNRINISHIIIDLCVLRLTYKDHSVFIITLEEGQKDIVETIVSPN